MDYTSNGKSPRAYEMAGPEMPSPAAGPIPVIVDYVGFKKQWSPEAVPTYWVELCFMPSTRMYLIRRRWSWYDKEKREQNEGCAETGMTRSDSAIVESYQTTILGILGKSYQATERISCVWSPAVKAKLHQAVPEPNIRKAKIGTVLRRKPGKEWW